MRRVARAVVVGTLAALAGAGPERAEGLPTERYLPVALALDAATAAVEACVKQGYRVSASVVDRAGVVRVVIRGDGAGPHTPESSTRKAYTAVSFRLPTAFMSEDAASTPAAAGIRHVDRTLMLGGGLPIVVGDDVVGAIGVGGAPGVDLDDTCAQAGIDKIKPRLTAR